MYKLKTGFNKNDVHYRILERSSSRYFCEVSSIDTGAVIGYECGRIITSNATIATIAGKQVSFTSAEHIVDNNRFGMDDFEVFYPLRMRNNTYELYLAGIEHDNK